MVKERNPMINNINDIFQSVTDTSVLHDKIRHVSIKNDDFFVQQKAPIHLNANTVILVLSGSAVININYKRYTIQSNSCVVLSPYHIFNFIECTSDFKCESLIIDKEYCRNTNCYVIDSIKKRHDDKYYFHPTLSLDKPDAHLILNHFAAIYDSLENTGHLYYNQVVFNRIVAFLLDLSNIVEHGGIIPEDISMTRPEQLTGQFIKLLINNYRKEHHVNFYAGKLNITSHHMTLIVKNATGLSPYDMIFEMLYAESRLLLYQPKISIQEVAELLNFSDQSSFGKFFKRKSGISPIEYKKRQ